jgi:hypothetical protein
LTLTLPILMDHLERKPIQIFSASNAPAFEVLSARNKDRQVWTRALLPLMEAAKKFRFDSGCDAPGTGDAVRETAVEMLQGALFHLPHPVTWIEDSFDDGSDGSYLYLCIEEDDLIQVYHFTDLGAGAGECRFVLGQLPYTIDLAHPQDSFLFPQALSQNVTATTTAGEAIYAVKKFILTLATEGPEQETVSGKPFRKGLPHRHRQYQHTFVRVPLDRTQSSHGGSGGLSPRRRKHLVRGYLWGKNTRSRDQWRWIKPFWRGSTELGTVKRSHYVVG